MKTKYQAMGAIATLMSLTVASACAAVTASEAEQLKTTLTPFGAERAANKEGTIPAWTGQVPNVKSSVPNLPPKLFTDEKPVLVINAANADQYSDKLADGTKHLLKNYPGFRIDVYPTHRTAAAPQYVYDNTLWNATHAQLNGEVLDMKNYKGGIPFPIPKTGLEAIFNVQWSWRAPERQFSGEIWFVSSSGKRSMTTANTVIEDYPYYFKDRKDPWSGKYRGVNMIEVTAPAYSAGEKVFIMGPVDPINQDTVGYTFLTGQRRLRRIPSVQYDVPFTYTSGVTNYDDGYGFNGATDRFNWKLVGKQEIYLPYNNNNTAHVSDMDKLIGPQYVNPDHVRWELHRVWVVDATLKDGARHTVPKHRYYIDEDTWNIVISDQWDAKGQFWKNISLLTWCFPEIPLDMTIFNIIYNVQSKAYTVQNTVSHPGGGVTFKSYPPEYFSTQSLERSGVR